MLSSLGTVDSLGVPAFKAPGGDERLPLPTVSFRLASVSGNEGKSSSERRVWELLSSLGTVDSQDAPVFQAPGGDERLPLPTIGFRLASVSGNEGKSSSESRMYGVSAEFSGALSVKNWSG
ncbi:hypothetical protein DPMN_068531 [Dreissena polymorpha]|uniref:Uncharacterized protein n=1 Tax=Dreissena polymorpha TaxID=45954 RepID=A0A9D3Z1T2_DREPO|nr:hypothetical protein DPMN_068531 [Dreissena polymorpha]